MRFGKSVVVALVLTLALVGTALAAHPKAGKSYAGFTSSKYKNWRAPVKFKVTTNDKSLTGFT